MRLTWMQRELLEELYKMQPATVPALSEWIGDRPQVIRQRLEALERKRLARRGKQQQTGKRCREWHACVDEARRRGLLSASGEACVQPA